MITGNVVSLSARQPLHAQINDVLHDRHACYTSGPCMIMYWLSLHHILMVLCDSFVMIPQLPSKFYILESYK